MLFCPVLLFHTEAHHYRRSKNKPIIYHGCCQHAYISTRRRINDEDQPFPTLRVMLILVQNRRPTMITANDVNATKIPWIMGPFVSGLMVFGAGQSLGLAAMGFCVWYGSSSSLVGLFCTIHTEQVQLATANEENRPRDICGIGTERRSRREGRKEGRKVSSRQCF